MGLYTGNAYVERFWKKDSRLTPDLLHKRQYARIDRTLVNVGLTRILSVRIYRKREKKMRKIRQSEKFPSVLTGTKRVLYTELPVLTRWCVQSLSGAVICRSMDELWNIVE